MTHTPGPWPISGDRYDKRITIGEGLVEGPHGYEVAEVYSDDCPRELALANAHLIAAAPELLAALEKARNTLAGLGVPSIAANICDATIAKARGES